MDYDEPVVEDDYNAEEDEQDAEEEGIITEEESEEEEEEEGEKEVEQLQPDEEPTIIVPEEGIPFEIIKKDYIPKVKAVDIPGTVTIVVCKPNERRTTDEVTIYELSAMRSYLATMIEKNPIVFTDISGLTDPIDIAEKHIRDRRIPLLIRRFITKIFIEEWDPNEMSFPLSNMS